MTAYPCEIQDAKCSLQLVFGDVSTKLFELRHLCGNMIVWNWQLLLVTFDNIVLVAHFRSIFFSFPLIALPICHTIYTTFCLQCHVNCNCFKIAFTAYSLFKSRIFCSQNQTGKLKPFLRISRLEAVDTIFAFCG